MSEYNQYITAVNKIFDYLSKMKVGWDNLDNLNYIDSIEEYRQVVISSLELFKSPQQQPPKAPTAQSKPKIEEKSTQEVAKEW